MKYPMKFIFRGLLLLSFFLTVAVHATAQAAGTPYGMIARDCPSAPAQPGAITLSATTVNLNATFTASIAAVLYAKTYVWTLPSGLTGSSTGTSITITGATAGTYVAGTIKVAAVNDCGTSATSSNGLAVTVRPCSTAPATPGAMTLTTTVSQPASVPTGVALDTAATSPWVAHTSGAIQVNRVMECVNLPVKLNYTFTASVPAVPGATSYVWVLPNGLTGTSTTNTITIKAITAGTYAAGSIKVAAVNDCGTSGYSTSPDNIVVSP